MAAAAQTKKKARARRRRPGRPPADQANLRERLLDAAVECFKTTSIAATSLRSIAVAAGVTPAMVHYYFGSKERLLEAFITERILPEIATLAASVRAAGEDPRALIAAFVRGLHAAVVRRPWLPALWLREVIGEHGALREMLFKHVAERVPRLLVQRFAALQKEGAVSADLDPRLLVVSLVGLTLFPLAAQSIWRRLFDAQDVDVAALERTPSLCSTMASEALMLADRRLPLALSVAALAALAAACSQEKNPPFVGSLEWDRVAVTAELAEPVLRWDVAEATASKPARRCSSRIRAARTRGSRRRTAI